MVNFQSNLVTGLVGVGGACVLAKGWFDLKNSKANQKLANVEIVAGAVTLTLTALKICSSMNDFFNPERFITEKDLQELKIFLSKDNSSTLDYLKDKLWTGVAVVASLIVSTRTPIVNRLFRPISGQ